MENKELYDYLIKIQSIAKIGLVFSKDPYAITNYQQINDLTREMLEKFMEIKFNRPNYFSRDIYPTPSVTVRTVILSEDRQKALFVREANTQTYSFPGGWADLYDSASQTAKNEASQEAGADIDIIRLVGILNRTPFKTSVYIPEYLIIFEARLVGDLHEHEYETDEVRWFSLEQLPPLSRKVCREEIDRIIEAIKNGKTIFD
ncbi:MAG TPA: NUDIX domain-containing protein [Erysipelotrichaceae bacterium]|nr:NUDIX domain-containing protein [Erysipelotrichaceae bacterium]